jgi:hypothetical protein
MCACGARAEMKEDVPKKKRPTFRAHQKERFLFTSEFAFGF